MPPSRAAFVELIVHTWQWLVLLGLIVGLLLVDLLVFHREAYEMNTREAAIESAAWISIGVAFIARRARLARAARLRASTSRATSSRRALSVDNVFVWARHLQLLRDPQKYQHRVLFWGVFGALVLRAIFIFAGVALIEAFDWFLYVFGVFLVYTAGKVLRHRTRRHVHGERAAFLKLLQRVMPVSTELRRAQVLHQDQQEVGWRRRCSPCSCSSSPPT